MAFGNMGEIEHALHAKAITLHSRIRAGGDLSTARASVYRRFSTPRLAAMILGQLLPHHVKIPSMS